MKKSTITFNQLFINFQTSWGKDHDVIFFDIVFKLSKIVTNKEVFITFRNKLIDFKQKEFDKLCKAYFIKKMPLSHVVGKTTFMNLEFEISKKVLSPREVTESMTKEFIIRHQKDSYHKILDLCCGSGCIGISIKKYCPHFDVVCIDKYWTPLFDTNRNGIKNKTALTIDQADAIEYLNKQNSIDILISNPPYINPNNFDKGNMYRWENKHALVAKEEGLFFIKRYIDYLSTHNFNEAWIEFGYDQYDAIKKLVENKGNLSVEIPQNKQFVIIRKK